MTKVEYKIGDLISSLIKTDEKRVRFCILFFLAIFVASTFISIFFEMVNIHVWRHDAIPMLDDYWGKLISEGRWINYIVFPLLKRMGPELSVIVDLVCWGYFSYILSKGLDLKRLEFLVFFFLCLQIPSFYAIVGWPVTLLPTFLMLAVISYLSRYVSYIALFLISGLLFHGSFNNFYNITLLLILVNVRPQNSKDFFKILFWWVGGYVIGAFLMLLVTYGFTGVWGLKIDSWRQPHAIHSFSDIVFNLKTIWASYLSSMSTLGGAFTQWCLFIVSSGLLIFSLKKREKQLLFLLLGTFCTGIACFIQAFPLGFHVAVRTNFPFFLAIFVISIVCLRKCTFVGFLLCFSIAFHSFTVDFNSLQYYASLTNSWRNEIIKMNVPPYAVRTVVVCSSNEEVAQSEQKIIRNLRLKNYLTDPFSLNWQQFSIYQSIGYRHFKVEQCSNELKEEAKNGFLISWLYRDEDLYLWY